MSEEEGALMITPDLPEEEAERRWSRLAAKAAGRCRVTDCETPAKSAKQLCQAHGRSFYKWHWSAKQRGEEALGVDDWLSRARVRGGPHASESKPATPQARRREAYDSISAKSLLASLRTILANLDQRRQEIEDVAGKVRTALEALQTL